MVYNYRAEEGEQERLDALHERILFLEREFLRSVCRGFRGYMHSPRPGRDIVQATGARDATHSAQFELNIINLATRPGSVTSLS